MSIYHIGGNGGIKLEIVGGASVILPPEIAEAKIDPDEEVIERKDLNGNELEWSLGERHTIKCRIYNVEDDGYQLIRTMGQIIDTSKRDKVPIRVYPQYNPLVLTCEYYDCLFKGGWKFERIFEMLELGQKMPEVVFRSVGLRTTHSTHIDVLTGPGRVTVGGNRRIVAGGGARVTRG